MSCSAIRCVASPRDRHVDVQTIRSSSPRPVHDDVARFSSTSTAYLVVSTASSPARCGKVFAEPKQEPDCCDLGATHVAMLCREPETMSWRARSGSEDSGDDGLVSG